jgi:RNA polymerase sigma-70 factor (ECF subfamily)
MLEEAPVKELLRQIRGGDGPAAAELVRRYEPVIRSRIRVWLRMQDPRLRRVFDSMDICQSVLAAFFVRVAAGQYDLDQPDQLVALLLRIARNKLAHQVDKQQAQRRDVRRVETGAETLQVPAADVTPSELMAGRDLLDMIRRRLSAEERHLVDRRAEGLAWADIVKEMGGTPDGRRVQLARALDRVVSELGLEEGDMG